MLLLLRVRAQCKRKLDKGQVSAMKAHLFVSFACFSCRLTFADIGGYQQKWEMAKALRAPSASSGPQLSFLIALRVSTR